MHRRISVGFTAGAIAMASLAAGSGSLAATHSGRCNAHRHLRISRTVLIYRQRAGSDYGSPVTNYLACARPNGRSIVVAETAPANAEYPSNERLLELRLAGRYVGALDADDAAAAQACYSVGGTNCPRPYVALILTDVLRRARLILHEPASTRPLWMSPAGATVWAVSQSTTSAKLYGGVLARRGAHGLRLTPRLLATGHVTHVRLQGLTVRWSDQAGSHAVKLKR